MQERVLLIDGSAVFYRGYHAANPDPAAPDSATAISACWRRVHRLVAERRPTRLAIAFDVEGETFRNRLYPGDKSKGRENPAALCEQHALTRELFEIGGVPTLHVPDVESLVSAASPLPLGVRARA